MKTSGAVYKKLREVKFHHLIDLYRKYLKKTPLNCKYNYLYVLTDRDGQEREIGLCLVHQEDVMLKLGPSRLSGIIPHLMDICEAEEDCRHCNAFVSKYDRQAVKELFEKELATKSIRETKYPDICALEWVLERSAVGISSLGNIFQILINGIKKILKHKQE
jgi:hypothetical protein